MEKIKKNDFGEFLVEQGYITSTQLETAQMERHAEGYKRKLGAVLVALNFIRRPILLEALNKFDSELLAKEGYVESKIPHELLVELRCAPTGENEDTLYVSTFNEDPDYVMERLLPYVDKEIAFRPASASDVLSAIFSTRETVLEDGETNIYKLKENIVKSAMDLRASDIHLESGEETVHVRLRVDGVLVLYKTLNKNLERPLFATIKNDGNMDASETRVPQDGSFSREHNGRFVDFRVAVAPTVFGEKITIRILDKEKGLLPMEVLGLSERDTYRKIITNAEGIILIVGATGSGKSTTLYSTLLELDRLGKAIYTIEEPVEYRLQFINQIQVNRKVGIDFAAGTRALMRHDPDIIIIGEIRDNETAEQAVTASKTGHLVFGTLHAQNCQQAASRLVDLGVNIVDLSYTVKGLVAQKLVRTLCKTCAGVGCDECYNAGYKGRTLVSEVVQLRSPEDFKALIDGEMEYTTMLQDAKNKLLAGITTHEEIERVLGEHVDV